MAHPLLERFHISYNKQLNNLSRRVIERLKILGTNEFEVKKFNRKFVYSIIKQFNYNYEILRLIQQQSGLSITNIAHPLPLRTAHRHYHHRPRDW